MFAGGNPFGTPSIFWQGSSSRNSPFAPKPFGATTSTPANPFGFGATTPASPFGSTPQTGGGGFFSNDSTGVFGNNSSSNTGFQQKPAFGAGGGIFGTNTTTQMNHPFGTPATPLFGATSPATANPPASNFIFGQNTSAPPFGAQNTFGGGGSFITTSPFGGAATTTTRSTPMFGQSTTPSPSNPFNSIPFASSTTSIFGQSTATTTSPFAAGQSSPFGALVSNPATQSVVSGNQPQQEKKGSRVAGYTSTRVLEGEAGTPVDYQSISAMNSYNPKNHEELRWEDYELGDKGGIHSPFGQSTATITFGQQQQSPPNPFSASNSFALKSTTQSSSPFGLFSSAPTSTSVFGPFSGQATTQTPSFSTGFATNTPSSILLQPATNSPFSLSPSPATAAATSSLFPSSSFATNAQALSPLFQSTSAAASPFGLTSSSFSFNVDSQGSNPLFSTSSLGSTQPSPLFQSTTPSLGQMTTFGQNTSMPGQTNSSFAFNTTFGQTTNSPAAAAFGQNTGQTTTAPSNPFGQTTTPSNSFGQTTTPSNPSFGQSTTSSNPFGQFIPAASTSLFQSQSNPMGFVQPTPTVSSLFQSQTNQPGFAQPTPTLSTTLQSFQLQPSMPAQNFGTIGSGTFVQTTFGNTGGLFGQNTLCNPPATQSLAIAQPAPTNPFGTLPVLPELCIGSGASPSLKYGIASLPVVDKPAPVRVSSILTSRHVSHGRTRLPVRKYNPQVDGPKVPFFYDGEEEAPTTPKANALFIPRENPRALVICPVEQQKQQHTQTIIGKTMPSKHTSSGAIHEICKTPEAVSATPVNGFNSEDKEKDSVEKGSEEQVHPVKQNQKPNGVADSHGTPKGIPEIQALMPKLRKPDYYTEPMIQELEANERVEKGYCKHVKDFVVGRHGYGSIKFIGETDVRGLDLDSLILFNNREVRVYMDGCKKPPVGQGLNKPALVTLLNIKCMDKKTGQQYTEGPRIQKYKEMLKKKAEEQGAAFVSYEPIKGEWKFRVEHFN